MNTRNSEKITPLPKAKKWSTTGITSCSSRVSLACNESRHDSYSQFPRSLLGTPGSPTSHLCPKYEEEIRRADYDSRCHATSSNKSHPVWLAPGGGGTWVFFGWVCAAWDSRLAPRSKKKFPLNWYPILEMGQFFILCSRVQQECNSLLQ